MEIDNYGRNPQFRQLQEECTELATAVSHYIKARDGAERELIEELAEVCIYVQQAIEMLQCRSEFLDAVDAKINRLAERLEGSPV